jgi:uncharacterized HhH-GPD family protein
VKLHIAQDEAADEVLSTNPFALLAGMMLDQQVPMEWAFAGPATILDRFGTLDPATIADAPPDEFAEICSRTPAVHRFPGAMATRLQSLARSIVQTYGSDTASLWRTADSGDELLGRLKSLPGFGPQKAQIFLALLAKQLDVRPVGWELAAGAYGEEGFRSVADVRDAESLDKVRAFKKAQKLKKKAADQPSS